jgi:hypothetical protein
VSSFNPINEISLEEGIQKYQESAASAFDLLYQREFPMPEPPTCHSKEGVKPYRGELPSDLTSLSDNDLGTYMGLLTEWNNYVQTQLAEADTKLAEVRAIMELTEAKLRILYTRDPDGKKRSNPERDDLMTADRRYVEARSRVLHWETVYKYIKAIANSAENAFSAVSRRITQRGQEIDRMNRQGHVSGNSNTNGVPAGRMFGNRRGQ